VSGASAGPGPIAELCPACGLCCNGVLFGDVELSPEEHPAALRALGLTLAKKKQKLAFAQPCSCFDGTFCRVYTQRPKQCRAFECGLLKRVAAKETESAAALKLIARARTKAQKIREQMRRLGNSEEHLPLSRRYAQIMAAPIDLSGDEELVEVRAKLMLEVDALMKIIHREFLA